MSTLNYTTHGQTGNPAVLLLHGFMSCAAQWMLNIETLSQQFFLVNVELWGHGESPTPTDKKAYSVDAYNQQFEIIRQQLNIDQWHLVGQSYGAGVILNYALAYPDQTLKVVATNSRSAFGQLTTPDTTNSSASKSSPLAGDFELRNLPYHPIHARRFPEHVKDALVNKADAMTQDAVRLGGHLGGRLNSIELIGKLNRPLLITNGVYEKSFQKDIENLKTKYPYLEVVDLEGGHSVNIEAAEGFNKAVANFLSQ